MEVILGMHMYFNASMTTMNKKMKNERRLNREDELYVEYASHTICIKDCVVDSGNVMILMM